ncbi:MAG: hypothetical protein NC102_09865 [Clostridium sp.]|nr:hypothetical protein [Clostridium sp.]
MIAALIILGALLAVGIPLYLHHRLSDAKEPLVAPAPAAEPKEECCGLHIACEKDSLLASVSSEIVYYDDEELDAYKGRGVDQYADDEIEQFRDVLLTMRPDDIAGWARSLQLRGIALPGPVRDELLMIVSEARIAKAG